MSDKFPWFRLYSDILHDRKIKRICRDTGLSLSEVRGVWVTLLCLASESPERGVLLFDGGIPYDYDDIAEECGLETLKFHTLWMYLSKPEIGMVAFIEDEGIYYLPNWEKRQPKSDASGAERQKRYRERKKASRYGDALEGEEEVESEKEAEEELSPAQFKEVQEMLVGIYHDLSKLENRHYVQAYHLIVKYGLAAEDILRRSFWDWCEMTTEKGSKYNPRTPGWIERAENYVPADKVSVTADGGIEL